MKCEKCDHEQAGGNFCGKCGTPFKEVETAADGEATEVQSEVEVGGNGRTRRTFTADTQSSGNNSSTTK